MRLYKKYCCESKNYNDCVKLVETCAHENRCDYIIECLPGVYIGYLLVQESNLVPAADVVEVRHGYWYITEYEYINCSECGHMHYTGMDSTDQAKQNLIDGKVPNYCPNCGAKMDGKDGE